MCPRAGGLDFLVAVGLLTFVSKFSDDWEPMMAAGVLALIPACIFFAFIQRYVV
jgi:multiple sugar transport system permease protein